MRPVVASLFGTTFRGWFGVGIGFSQHWRHPYHVGIMFIMEDGAQIGFEASMSKNGWIQFPYLEKAKHYTGYENAMHGRTIEVMHLSLSDGQIETLYIEAKRMTLSVKKYPSKLTMVWKLLHQRRGWPMRRSKNVVDCSEGIARLLNKVGIDLRDEDNPIFDALSPSEVWVNAKSTTGA